MFIRIDGNIFRKDNILSVNIILEPINGKEVYSVILILKDGYYERHTAGSYNTIEEAVVKIDEIEQLLKS
jgi:hypothetical protein